jgi:hypothetical protein
MTIPPLQKNVLSEKKINLTVDAIPTVYIGKPDFFGLCDAEDNEFIAELLSGPLLNNATCNTAKIFAPRTEDMDTGFLMPVDDALIVSKEEPEDLTHLAPVAGDESVPLDIPLLEDLLATLDEASFSFVDPSDDEIPRFEYIHHIPQMSQVADVPPKKEMPVGVDAYGAVSSGVPSTMLLQSSVDPTMLQFPGSSVLSPYQDVVDSPASAKSIQSSHSPAPLNHMDDPLFSERLVGNSPSPSPYGLNVGSPCLGGNAATTCPTSSFNVSPAIPYDSFNVQYSGNDPPRINESDTKMNEIPW